MSIRQSKDDIIKEIRDLRTLIGTMSYRTYTVDGLVESFEINNKEEALNQLNKIQDKVFNI